MLVYYTDIRIWPVLVERIKSLAETLVMTRRAFQMQCKPKRFIIRGSTELKMRFAKRVRLNGKGRRKPSPLLTKHQFVQVISSSLTHYSCQESDITLLYQLHLVMFFSHLSRFEVMYLIYSGRLLYNVKGSIANEILPSSEAIFSKNATASSKRIFV